MANKIDDNSMPRVSVIIPMRNEKKHIEKCLESLLLNDYPKDRMEILAIDGMSVDGTREIIENYARKYPFVKLVDNERKTTPCAFNLGVSASEGDFIIIMGAHAVYEKDYISKCVQYSGQYGADNVGGVRVALPARETAFAKAVVQAISHPFGAGDAAYITGASSPRWVDTVFGGCYKR
ncbi:glycosyltransferase family 2 protein, partial [Candidatus Micrarchaeota archaeon]